MRKLWWSFALKAVILFVLAVAAVGAAVMLLWNTLLPPLFGWPALTFWQALGLLVLSRLLVGGLRGRWGHGGHAWRARMAARWDRMTDEERARFRAGFGHGCGRREEPPASPMV